MGPPSFRNSQVQQATLCFNEKEYFAFFCTWVVSSKTTVAQKCSGAMEIQKYDQPMDQWTDGRADMGRC